MARRSFPELLDATLARARARGSLTERELAELEAAAATHPQPPLREASDAGGIEWDRLLDGYARVRNERSTPQLPIENILGKLP